MDILNLVTFAIALTSLLGAFIVPILNNRTRWLELHHEAKQGEQKERLAFLRDTQSKVIVLLAEHEKSVHLAISDEGFHRSERATHAALANSHLRLVIGHIRAIPDDKLAELAKAIGDIHAATNKSGTGDRLYELANDAITRLGEMINLEMKLVPEVKSRWKLW